MSNQPSTTAAERTNKRVAYINEALGTPAPQEAPAAATEETREKATFTQIAGNFCVAICISDDELDDSIYFSVLGGFHWKLAGFTSELDAEDFDALLEGSHPRYKLTINGGKQSETMYGNVSVKKEIRSGGASRFRKA